MHRAAHGGGEFLRDREAKAEAEAAVAAGAGVVNMGEAIKDGLELAGWNPDAGIFDGEADRSEFRRRIETTL